VKNLPLDLKINDIINHIENHVPGSGEEIDNVIFELDFDD